MLLRRIVMARDHEKCRRCGKEHKSGRGGALETAHIFPKGSHPSMRYLLENALALCYSCHHHFAHKDPIGFSDWIAGEIGKEALDRLRAIAGSEGKTDREADRLYLEQQAERYNVIVYNSVVKPDRKRRIK